MPTHKQITVEPDENQTASGSKANRAALKTMFAAAPYFNDYTMDKLMDANDIYQLPVVDKNKKVIGLKRSWRAICRR